MPGKSDYSERGWNHPEYASLLYPQALLDHLCSETSGKPENAYLCLIILISLNFENKEDKQNKRDF
jgi:hypothetical protein